MGGEPNLNAENFVAEEGLSPRGRGTPVLAMFSTLKVGSIPAWAGNPSRRR